MKNKCSIGDLNFTLEKNCGDHNFGIQISTSAFLTKCFDEVKLKFDKNATIELVRTFNISEKEQEIYKLRTEYIQVAFGMVNFSGIWYCFKITGYDAPRLRRAWERHLFPQCI